MKRDRLNKTLLTGLFIVICVIYLMPIFTVIIDPGAGPVARCTSSRVMTIFTGRPDLRDSATATGSR